eukprot:TRINITY_DN1252_c0_g1_i1.p1 TRINITY_DN1252_c0_g1~~TRINITY_DN1252_c0_g1_i1.p1  ORF type:complete len:149 (+),score=25.98 TRINITY_DN1252_c0_g1_i1:68-448(+)
MLQEFLLEFEKNAKLSDELVMRFALEDFDIPLELTNHLERNEDKLALQTIIDKYSGKIPIFEEWLHKLHKIPLQIVSKLVPIILPYRNAIRDVLDVSDLTVDIILSFSIVARNGEIFFLGGQDGAI